MNALAVGDSVSCFASMIVALYNIAYVYRKVNELQEGVEAADFALVMIG